MSRSPIIKKLNQIFSQGYIPSRGNQTYDFVTHNGENITNLANCFEHACFNLANQHFEDYDITHHDSLGFFGFIDSIISEVPDDATEKMFNMLKETGLTIDKDNPFKDLNDNKWRIALYFNYWKDVGCLFDYHYLLQEKDGTWSSKYGRNPELEYFKTCPLKYKKEYALYGNFVITNPHAKTTITTNKTMIDFQK